MALPTGGYLYEVAKRALAAREERKKAENEASLQRAFEEYDKHYESFDDEGNPIPQAYAAPDPVSKAGTRAKWSALGAPQAGAIAAAGGPQPLDPLRLAAEETAIGASIKGAGLGLKAAGGLVGRAAKEGAKEGAEQVAKGADDIAAAGAYTPEDVAEAKRLWAEMGTESPYFKRWFDDSKVVNEDGSPLIVYHGGLDVVEGPGVFKPSKRGALGAGTYFTPSKERAAMYAGEFKATGGGVTPVYLDMKNPLILDGRGHPVAEGFEKLGMDPEKALDLVDRLEEQHGYIGTELKRMAQRQGYDGIIQYAPHHGGNISELVVFDPKQIKSATSNVGTFDPADRNITKMNLLGAGAAAEAARRTFEKEEKE